MSAVITDKSSIVDKVVFVRVSFGCMGNTKKVSTIGDLLNTDADKNWLKVNTLLLDSPELAAITKADGQMRQYLYSVCLPYDTGLLALPKGLIEVAEERLARYQETERPALVDAFIAAYPERCQAASDHKGSLYNPMDYPSPEAVRAKFYFDYQYLTFEVPEVMKYKGLASKAEQQFHAKLAQASDEITILMRETLLDLVNHLKIALEPNADGKPKRLFQSSITNIQEFLNTFKARNITNDTDLESIVTDLQAMVTPGFSVDTLRNDDSFKSSFHKSMEGMTEKLTTLVEVIPGRKFKTVE